MPSDGIHSASPTETILPSLISGGVWLIYAIFMIVAIFKIASMYLGALNPPGR